jgi:hypothetical protein
MFQVYPELSSRQVLTTEWVNGITIDKVRYSTAAERKFSVISVLPAHTDATPPASELPGGLPSPAKLP